MKHKKTAPVTKITEYNRLKALVVTAYLLGQKMGLKGFTYMNSECVAQRKDLVGHILREEI
jgi:hypothetical protein